MKGGYRNWESSASFWETSHYRKSSWSFIRDSTEVIFPGEYARC